MQTQFHKVNGPPLGLVKLVMSLSLLGSASVALGAPKQTVSPTGAYAPHPKHCLDERQWQGANEHHPLNLFEGRAQLWTPCEYALRDAGYSVKFPLKTPIMMDGFVIRQGLTERQAVGKSKRKAAFKEVERKLIEKMQVLFFNSKLSTKYPIYFHEVHFEGQAEVSVRYEEPLDWNPILLRDANFDERRRALKLPSTELIAPIEVDGIGVVFWERSPGEAPTALEQLELTLGGKVISVDLKAVRAARQVESKKVEAHYVKVVRGMLLIGEERSLAFAPTGTLWGMEGEEESPKVMGRWRASEGPLEIALGTPKALKRAEKKKRLKFTPLSMIIDEAPERIIIKHPKLSGDYQVARMKPHPPPKSLLDEPPGQGAQSGKPIKILENGKLDKERGGERAPTFEPQDW